MNAALNLLTRVEDAISSGSLSRRSEMLRHVTDLFVLGAPQCTDDDVALFDTVFARLVAEIEQSARALLAVRLAPIPNAPPNTIRTLAFDDAIDVAGPVLTQSERLDEAALVENASTKGQGHMLAISRRRVLSEAVTDVLVTLGDRQVVLSTAENPGARFSEAGFAKLVQRSDGDDGLALRVGSRRELPLPLLLALIDKASSAVRAKLEAVHPHAKGEVRQAVSEATERVRDDVLGRIKDHAAALAFVETLHRAGQLDDERVRSFAQSGRLAETVAALAVRSELSLPFVERAMVEERADTIVVIAKALALTWPTVRALLVLHGRNRPSGGRAIDQALASFERLKTVTAQEIMHFWRVREHGEAPRRTS
jgi:uncharacterized protein (DUF2336 family)